MLQHPEQHPHLLGFGNENGVVRAEIGDGYDVFLAACPSFALPFADPPSEILGPSAGGGG